MGFQLVIALGIGMLTTLIAAKSPPVRILEKGAFSGIQEKREQIITNEVQWAKLWEQHAVRIPKTKPAPKIDFDKESVVFVALGTKRTGGYSIEILDLQTTADKTEILVRMKSPKPGAMTIQAITSPFCIAAVPRITKPATFRYVDGPAATATQRQATKKDGS
jgi:hypothetical protein